MEEIKMTQEQLDALISQKVSEAKTGLYTEEDLNRKVTSEVDRRVETGIQKGLETQRQKWEKEYTERAKLTAEELAKKELEEKSKQILEKERDILKKANLIEAKHMLSEASIPKSHYEKFIGMLVTDSEDGTKANVQNFIDMFNATKTDIETSIKGDLAKVPKPAGGNGGGVITKTDFDKMGYSEKLKFKQTNPELYKQFTK